MRLRALAAGVAVLGLAACGGGGRTYRMTSGSMEPTLRLGQKITVETGAYADHGPARGDIVAFHAPRGVAESRCGDPRSGEGTRSPCARALPGGSGLVQVKRVVALPGDTIALRRGRAVVDGHPLPEPYARPCPAGDTACDFPRPVTVPAGSYYVLGDNRGASADSRFWGPLPRGALIGRVQPGS